MTQPSMYAQRMAKLASRIFGVAPRNMPNGSTKVIQMYSEKPLYKRHEIVNYYPRHPEATQIFAKLRHHGMYRDEHLEFVEYMKRLRKKRGKGKPKKGHGKKAQTRK